MFTLCKNGKDICMIHLLIIISILIPRQPGGGVGVWSWEENSKQVEHFVYDSQAEISAYGTGWWDI